MFAAVSCSQGLPTTTLTVDGHAAQAEIALTAEAREQGLMHRESMPADHGMLFVYRDEAPRAFWMKNTRIPLSIAFANRKGEIVRIADMKPFDVSRTPSLSSATYALEMNVGWFAERGIERGSVITGIPTDLKVE